MRAWMGGGAPAGRPHELVRLVTRLAVAQVVMAAAVGLPFSRRHVPSILITLGLVAALGVLALLVRSPTRTAWLIAVVSELGLFLYGLDRFVVSRYVGGTLFALIIVGTLLQPSVARAYSVHGGSRPATLPADEATLGEAIGESLGDAGETLGGRTVG